jgi:AcrR family transcriptional regulator
LSTADGLGRRERKKLETKERLVDCAVGLFASRGYDATTMEEIGECADVARATVFNYFARKEDIVSEVFRRRRDEVAVLISQAAEQGADTAGRLRHVLTGWARLYQDDAATGRAVVQAWLRAGGPLMPDASQTAELFAGVIRSGQELGDVPPGVDAARAGLVILDAYLGVLFRWVGDEDFAFEQELMAALDLILTGISAARPRPWS